MNRINLNTNIEMTEDMAAISDHNGGHMYSFQQ
jgi:hypothetical protein